MISGMHGFLVFVMFCIVVAILLRLVPAPVRAIIVGLACLSFVALIIALYN
jgi:hypothetical protein